MTFQLLSYIGLFSYLSSTVKVPNYWSYTPGKCGNITIKLSQSLVYDYTTFLLNFLQYYLIRLPHMINLNFPSRLPPEIASSFKLNLTATYLIGISVTNGSKYFCRKEIISNTLFYPPSCYVFILSLLSK